MAFNPMFKAIEKENAKEVEIVKAASYKGIAWKTLFLVMLTIISATLISVFGIIKEQADGSAGTIKVAPWLYGVLGASFFVSIFALIIGSIFPKSAVFFGPVYAISEGALVGVLTVILNIVLKWGAFIAVSATLAIFFITLVFNMFASFRAKSAVVKITSIMGTALLVFFIVFLVMRLVAPGAINSGISNLGQNAAFGISVALTVFLLIYGAFLLSSQFTRAQMLVESGSEKSYEWSAAFGILFALILIYMEIVRLLILIAGRRD